MVFYSNGIFYQELSVLHKLYVFWPLSEPVRTLRHVFALSCDTLLTLVQCSICSLSSFLVHSSVSQSPLILLSWLAKLSFINRNCSVENRTCSHDRKFYRSETFRDYSTDCHRLAPFLVLSISSTAMVCRYIMSFDGFTEGDTGLTVRQAISEHLVIENVTFIGSTLTACKIFGASASTLQCPTYSCRNPVIPVEFRWNPAGIQSFQWNSSGIHRNPQEFCWNSTRIRLKSSRLRLKYCRYCHNL